MLQSFFESTLGKAVVVAIIAIIFLLILIPTGKERKEKVDVKAMTVSALMIALAVGLGLIKVFEMPQGGSVTAFSMLPIVIVGYFYGVRRGVIAGICLGLLNLIFGPYVIHPAQMLLDYPIAFGALGLSGIFSKMKNGLAIGYITAIIGRYACAVLSGIIFFAEYTPEGFNPVTWSLWYNFTYIFAEGVITVIIISLPMVKNAFYRLKSRI
ncbi:thiamine transporter [Peptostreptococcaceae bacterium pGA-8]|nr:thiamine transporter [Peptostreptococcaceae bacterium pGA-8]